MAGIISSLGAGSAGVLTTDTLEKLRKSDEAKRITPIETTIKQNEVRALDVKTLKNLASEFKSSLLSLSSESSYSNVDTSLSGDSVEVSASAGASVQSFSLHVKQLATKQISQSAGFASKDALIGQNGNLSLTIDSKKYDIQINENMSIKDLSQSIFEKTDGKITASTLNVGGENPYALVLKSTNTGAKNAFEITGDQNILDKFGFNKLTQEAKDAVFQYDGVDIKRSSNKVDDLISGVSIELKKASKAQDDESGLTTVNITRKTSDMVTNIDGFVKKYNALISNLNTVTKFDNNANAAGTFQGNVEVNSIKRQIKDSIVPLSGNLESFGITMSRNGELEFDKSKLQTIIDKDYSKVKDFFLGDENKKGLFVNAKDTIDELTSSKNGLFKLVETSVEDKANVLKKQLSLAKQNLDSKYELLTKQFEVYDSAIQKMTAGFASMKLMIDQSLAKQ